MKKIMRSIGKIRILREARESHQIWPHLGVELALRSNCLKMK